MSANATELFTEMVSDVRSRGFVRVSGDPMSPCQESTVEATPGRSYTLRTPEYNVAAQRRGDPVWAVANALHFFASTEMAEPLRAYNKHADRFLTGDLWIGAYGAIAMPQVWDCVELLKRSPDSRRAIVSMGGFATESDLNRPACWSHLQFLRSRFGLDLVCYQRSLNLYGVFAYDLVVLTNLLHMVANSVAMPVGHFHWLFGSLHAKASDVDREHVGGRHDSILLPTELMRDYNACWETFNNREAVCALSRKSTVSG